MTRRRENLKAVLQSNGPIVQIFYSMPRWAGFSAVAAALFHALFVVHETKTLAILGMIYSRRLARSRMRHVGYLAGWSLEQAQVSSVEGIPLRDCARLSDA
jgi:hypothetical protein